AACQVESKSTGSEINIPNNGISGHAEKIFDGDSFIFRSDEGERLEVRILRIDAPERSQAHASQSRRALDKATRGKLYLIKDSVDRYNRVLAHVVRQSDQQDIAEWMISQGHAWVYHRYRDNKDLMALENAARSQQLGLWRDADANSPTPPWQWRKQSRSR
ncbi:MAG: thermonuclease family protein, partial [Gammaproteobacteria bacterium]|nr:thermonuclease family protein [Gammaproteobacteria bacterium]